ncbi:MAG: GAF domain-containing SpoIIE family protein phosphatase [Treponema sp.]|nr:GAF domain-containing SpoIIE family protein phosphatase [Treponema sp.]
MTTIDSFINVPLLATAITGLILFIFLFLIKLRRPETNKVSFVYYLDCVIIVAGAIYSYISKLNFYFVCAIVLAEVIMVPYLIIRALDTPKRQERRAEKKAASEKNKSILDNTISKAELQEIEDKFQNRLDVNNDLIAKLSTFFSSDNSLENYLEYCNTLLTDAVKADGCVILMSDDYDNTLAVKSFKGDFPPPYRLPDDLPHKPIRVETNFKFAHFTLADNIFGKVFEGKKPILVADSVKDPRIYQNGPEEFLRCGSYIFIPIKQMDDCLGVIALSRNPQNDKFTKADLDSATVLADAVSMTMKPLYSFLAYAEHTELNKDGTTATKYQKTLIPQKLPVIPNTSIGCFSNNVESVCGDYYDVVISRRDRFSFVMADVAGKGMNSLIVMIMIRAILRLAVNTSQKAATIIEWANKSLCNDSSKIDHFASVALINYNSSTKEAEIATCGNNPVFHYVAATREIKQISLPSEPMGVTKETVYENINIKLSAGDILATCTDGLLESLNENSIQYSAESLKNVIKKNCNANAKDISNRVKDDLKKYCGNAQQYDDQSLLVIKIQ